MRIHDVKPGKNRFCGPAALSAITGRSVDEIVAGFHANNPGDKVMGTHTWELHGVLKLYGLHLAGVPTGYRKTLAAWLKANKSIRTPGRVFLLAAGNHWVVVSGRRIVCGKVMKIVSVRDYPHRRARVTEAWEIQGTLLRGVPEKIKARLTEKKAKAKAASKRSSAMSKVRALAKEHAITIEKEQDYWIVWPPEGISDEDDPYEGDHIAWDVNDVREAVETYVKLKSAASCTSDVSEPSPSQSVLGA